METKNEIQLVQVPKIVHKLQELGANVTKRLEDLNINNLVATEDTMKSLKELRAELNKELGDFEDQRKLIKTGVLNPYNEFEAIYKTEISERYNSAINTLKDKIAVVETQIKDKKKAVVKAYYDELCLSEKIDFISFEKMNMDINLSTSEKAYKEKCSEFINKVIDDLNLIKTTEFEAEILTEYKTNLNASLAITTVKTRKANEAIEAERLKQIQINQRIAKLKSIGMLLDDMTKCYIYDDENFIAETVIKNATPDEFTKKFIEYEERIKGIERAKLTGTSDPLKENQPQIQFVSAPTVKTTEEAVTASFEVTGTMSQLKALGQYMKSNNITYKNI
jgi:hypothetical protein